MAQHDYVIDNASGATVRADINSALSAIQTLNSGTSAPSSTAAGMLWLDTTGGAPYALKVRDAGNNHWLTLASVTDPGSDGNIETSATIKGTIDSSAIFPDDYPLQVKSTAKTDKFVTTNTSYTLVTGLTVDITPASSSNKVLVSAMVNVSNNTANFVYVSLRRGTSTDILLGDAVTNQPQASAMTFIAGLGNTGSIITIPLQFLDSPSTTSSTTYGVYIRCADPGNAYVNRSYRDSANTSHDATVPSTITAIEVKG